jgi:hypothetical protein
VQKVSYNVLGLRRFDRPKKGFAEQRPGRPKCGGEKPYKGAKRRLGVFVAQAAYWRRCVNRLLAEVKSYYEAPAMDGGRAPCLAKYCFILSTIIL